MKEKITIVASFVSEFFAIQDILNNTSKLFMREKKDHQCVICDRFFGSLDYLNKDIQRIHEGRKDHKQL